MIKKIHERIRKKQLQSSNSTTTCLILTSQTNSFVHQLKIHKYCLLVWKYNFYLISIYVISTRNQTYKLQTKHKTKWLKALSKYKCKILSYVPTIPHKDNETNEKFYRKVAFLMYTEMVNFRPQSWKKLQNKNPEDWGLSWHPCYNSRD